MNSIMERLSALERMDINKWSSSPVRNTVIEARHEIERLTAKVAELEASLEYATSVLGSNMEDAHDQQLLAERLTAENERLRNLAAAIMAHMDDLPVKHPQQTERRNELRRQFDGLFSHTQQTTVCSQEKPRPTDCVQPNKCGWHKVRTEPDINMWLCSVPSCEHMAKALTAKANA